MARQPAARSRSAPKPTAAELRRELERRRFDLLSTHEKRLLKGLREGKTVQEARGHKAAEHVIRKAKSEAATGLTPYERQAIIKFGREQARLRTKVTGEPSDPKTFIDKAAALAQRDGYGAIRDIRSRLKAMHRERAKQGKVIRIANRAAHQAEMEGFADELDLDWAWFFYG